MIIVEPKMAYEGRTPWPEPLSVASPRPLGDDWWVENVFSELRQHGRES